MGKKLVVIILLFLYQANTTVFAKEYAADSQQAKWQNSVTRLRCGLSHNIPGYGSIKFVNEAGHKEYSTLTIDGNRAVEFSNATMKFMPNTWQKHIDSVAGWDFYLGPEGEDNWFSQRQTRRILDALQDGLMPTISHIDNNNLLDKIVAKVAVVNFNPAFAEYAKCQSNLIPVSFDEVRNSDVNFVTASARLNEETKQWLDYVLVYVDDPSIRKIELAGYTDSIGSFRANHKLASERVEAVKDYLVKAGVKEDLLRLRVLGEQRPVASNYTANGRSQNRRVNIKISR